MSACTDPAVNLPMEDSLLGEVESGARPDTLRLWVNDECCVRGPNRSATSGWHRASAMRRFGVPMYRRSTGGGTVYHDPGNLNWSFYLRRTEGMTGGRRMFRECGGLIAGTLEELGLNAVFAAPNRIDVAGRKISGLASRASFGAVLVHGTLLVTADLARLEAVCVPPPGCPPVANLRDFVPGLTAERTAAIIARHAARW